EGTIPEGEYGAGTVTIFDRGDLDVMNRTEGKIVFSIQGARLKGTYALIKFKNDENRKNWLLIRTE
ncbi:MAG TPA: DNA polymerase ligase N-terminal domain-containing protein, partial [Methanomassiliicoccaceae archaeon]|nr:DNA polymerase ligase N-terminal domain-containing protein [Methanomassiliicoccaceae archaeon]